MNAEQTNNIILSLLAVFVWFVINIRVAAGFGSVGERVVDGLVAGVVLLVSIYYGLRFFGILEIADDDPADSD